jgi:hypothetical protein
MLGLSTKKPEWPSSDAEWWRKKRERNRKFLHDPGFEYAEIRSFQPYVYEVETYDHANRWQIALLMKRAGDRRI